MIKDIKEHRGAYFLEQIGEMLNKANQPCYLDTGECFGQELVMGRNASLFASNTPISDIEYDCKYLLFNLASYFPNVISMSSFKVFVLTSYFLIACSYF